MNKQDLYRVILYAKDYAQCRRRLEQLGVHVLRELPIISGYVVDVPGNAVIRLAECQGVSYIAADVETEIQMNVASRVVAADKLHRKRITGKGVCIAIIDTGIYPHYDFLRPTNRIKAFVDLTDEKGKQEPYDDNGHGTFVAGVAAGNGFQSRGKYQGIAPEADIVVIRAMNKNGRGSTGNVLAAMQWIADNKDRYGIKVLSLSLGSAASNLQRDDAMIRGAEALWDMGITVVVAAGNNGPESQTITVPGVSNKIITVGALDDRRTIVIDDDGIADFSSRGPVGRRIKPDLVAPGVKVQSVKSDLEYRPGGRIRSGIPQYARMSGTSVATPIVAGIVALLLQQRPDMTPDQVKKWLLDHTVPITRDEMAEGKGLIRCE
ncbi:MAG: S8 family peptidase [Christensenellales bacterium]